MLYPKTTCRAITLLLATLLIGPAMLGNRQAMGDESELEFVAQYMDATTIAVVKLDIKPIDFMALDGWLKQSAPSLYETMQEESPQLLGGALHEARDSGELQPVTYGVISMKNLVSKYERHRAPYPWQAESETDFDPNNVPVVYTITPSGPQQMRVLDASRGLAENPHLSAALAEVDQFPLYGVLVPPPYAKRAIREQMPELPELIGGGPSSLLTEGLVWAAIGVDPNSFSLKLVIQSESDAAAQALAQRLPVMFNKLNQHTDSKWRKTWLPETALEATLRQFCPKPDGDRLVLDLTDSPALSIALVGMLKAIDSSKNMVDDIEKVEAMKYLMLAFHNHHDTFKSFPPSNDAKYRDETGRPNLSWRVHILPYLEESDLYKQFKLGEPWDSEHNIKLLPKMPSIYFTGKRDLKPGHTTIQAPMGPDTVQGGWKYEEDEEKKLRGVRMADIWDGLSNTIGLIEVKDELAVPWTAPMDYEFDPEDPGAGIQVDSDGVFVSGFMDGRVHRESLENNRKQMLYLFQKSDSQPVTIK